jgi:hypothetical protein
MTCQATWHQTWVCDRPDHHTDLMHAEHTPDGTLIATWFGDDRTPEQKMGQVGHDALGDD